MVRRKKNRISPKVDLCLWSLLFIVIITIGVIRSLL